MSDPTQPLATVEIFPVTGIGEIRPGDDLGAILTRCAPWLADGDVLVVTSKIVSKAEGRLRSVGSADTEQRETVRQQAIDDETVRVVARRGTLRIVADRRGVVMAGAGVDASNVARDEIALLPADPDASARGIRDAVEIRLGVRVGVVISDSLGRAWRAGIIDQALGVAGLASVVDLRGRIDRHGNELNATQVAVADEIASAADLVKGKLADVPAAVVRGLGRAGQDGRVRLSDDGAGSGPLIRSAAEDMFRLGTDEAVAVGRADGAGSRGTPGALHVDAVALVGALADAGPARNAVRAACLGFLLARPDTVWRSCVPGHLTASALVVDPSRSAVLLTLHPRVGRWVQLGGHCEPGDATVLGAATREAREESGIDDLWVDPVPIGLDVHPVTCSLGVPTRHFDVRFLAVAPAGAESVISDESLDLRWFGWDELPEESAADLGWFVAQARSRLSS